MGHIPRRVCPAIRRLRIASAAGPGAEAGSVNEDKGRRRRGRELPPIGLGREVRLPQGKKVGERRPPRLPPLPPTLAGAQLRLPHRPQRLSTPKKSPLLPPSTEEAFRKPPPSRRGGCAERNRRRRGPGDETAACSLVRAPVRLAYLAFSFPLKRGAWFGIATWRVPNDACAWSWLRAFVWEC
uniref:Uncharacterized protein n=1 Tax=Tetraselmis sp. GSL018 TaxID=582737 RepID=A0A061RQ40_9CHLO